MSGRFFDSELEALETYPAFSADIERSALCVLLSYGYTPATHSTYRGRAKLEPGCLLLISLLQPESGIWPCWDMVTVAHAGLTRPCADIVHEVVDALMLLSE
jgi:asparagine synthase (glutamine-hydrolysing)